MLMIIITTGYILYILMMSALMINGILWFLSSNGTCQYKCTHLKIQPCQSSSTSSSSSPLSYVWPISQSNSFQDNLHAIIQINIIWFALPVWEGWATSLGERQRQQSSSSVDTVMMPRRVRKLCQVRWLASCTALLQNIFFSFVSVILVDIIIIIMDDDEGYKKFLLRMLPWFSFKTGFWSHDAEMCTHGVGARGGDLFVLRCQCLSYISIIFSYIILADASWFAMPVCFLVLKFWILCQGYVLSVQTIKTNPHIITYNWYRKLDHESFLSVSNQRLS